MCGFCGTHFQKRMSPRWVDWLSALWNGCAPLLHASDAKDIYRTVASIDRQIAAKRSKIRRESRAMRDGVGMAVLGTCVAQVVAAVGAVLVGGLVATLALNPRLGLWSCLFVGPILVKAAVKWANPNRGSLISLRESLSELRSELQVLEQQRRRLAFIVEGRPPQRGLVLLTMTTRLIPLGALLALLVGIIIV